MDLETLRYDRMSSVLVVVFYAAINLLGSRHAVTLADYNGNVLSIVSITDRTERDLSKRFDEQDIDWERVEDQLRVWSHLLHVGKRLRVEISFICKEVSRSTSMTTRQSTRRVEATAVQLAERDELLEEQETSGRSRVWSNVYNLMRCTGPPCDGRYRWRDANRKHFRLDTSILTKLVQYAEEGNQLDTHQDVPPRILDLIYAKEREGIERKLKRKASGSEGERPINIINVLPGSYYQAQALIEGSLGSNLETSDVAQGRRSDGLRIPKPRDEAPISYRQWHCAQINNPTWKAGFWEARWITMDACLDLRYVYADQDVNFYVT